ncbi:hypothetical protein QTN25_004249 [Entamoeba marina]
MLINFQKIVLQHNISPNFLKKFVNVEEIGFDTKYLQNANIVPQDNFFQQFEFKSLKQITFYIDYFDSTMAKIITSKMLLGINKEVKILLKIFFSSDIKSLKDSYQELFATRPNFYVIISTIYSLDDLPPTNCFIKASPFQILNTDSLSKIIYNEFIQNFDVFSIELFLSDPILTNLPQYGNFQQPQLQKYQQIQYVYNQLNNQNQTMHYYQGFGYQIAPQQMNQGFIKKLILPPSLKNLELKHMEKIQSLDLDSFTSLEIIELESIPLLTNITLPLCLKNLILSYISKGVNAPLSLSNITDTNLHKFHVQHCNKIYRITLPQTVNDLFIKSCDQLQINNLYDLSVSKEDMFNYADHCD